MGAGGALAAFTEAQTLQAKREKAAGPCRNLCVKRAAVAHGNNSSLQPCFARRLFQVRSWLKNPAAGFCGRRRTPQKNLASLVSQPRAKSLKSHAGNSWQRNHGTVILGSCFRGTSSQRQRFFWHFGPLDKGPLVILRILL